MPVRRLLRYYGRLKGRTLARARPGDHALARALARRRGPTSAIDQLSKGMAQKVQFIAAVVSQPQLLILDEPFSGLDPVNAEALRDAVLELRREGTTIVFSTHDMGAAESMCDRIFMIFKGSKVLDGSLDEIQARVRPRHGPRPARRRRGGARRAAGRRSRQRPRQLPGRAADGRPAGVPAAARRSAPTVRHFEITKPSLHDIFVRIARPTDEELTRGRGGGLMKRILTDRPVRVPDARPTKAFIIGILLMPVLMVGFITFMNYAERHADTDRPPVRRDRRDRRALRRARGQAAGEHNAEAGERRRHRPGPHFCPKRVDPAGRPLDDVKVELSEQVQDEGALRVRRDSRRTCSTPSQKAADRSYYSREHVVRAAARLAAHDRSNDEIAQAPLRRSAGVDRGAGRRSSPRDAPRHDVRPGRAAAGRHGRRGARKWTSSRASACRSSSWS